MGVAGNPAGAGVIICLGQKTWNIGVNFVGICIAAIQGLFAIGIIARKI